MKRRRLVGGDYTITTALSSRFIKNLNRGATRRWAKFVMSRNTKGKHVINHIRETEKKRKVFTSKEKASLAWLSLNHLGTREPIKDSFFIDHPLLISKVRSSAPLIHRFSLFKMVSANREMVVYCFDTLIAHYNNEQVPPPAFNDGQYPLFVTWKKIVNGGEPRLRGCIGTLEARAIVNGFKDYALTSALRDRRFPPIQPKELPSLECTVSILTDYESGFQYDDWEVGKHGIIIEFTDPDYNVSRSATYLPEVAAHEGWTTIEAIDTLMRKAGFNGTITEFLRKRISLTRYQSTLYTMHYADYVSYVKRTRGEAPFINGLKA